MHLHACFVRHLDISMDLFIHPKAPTQNTCAHCQRSFSPKRTFRSASPRQPFVPGEPPILHHFPFPSTPQFVFFSNRAADSTTTKSSTHSWQLPLPPSLPYHLSEGPRIIQPVCVSSTPGGSLSFRRKPTHSTHRTTHLNLPIQPPFSTSVSTKGRESYIGFSFRQAAISNYFRHRFPTTQNLSFPLRILRSAPFNSTCVEAKG